MTDRPYPDLNTQAKILGEVARIAALEHSGESHHPGDVAARVIVAVEGAALAIEVLWDKGIL